MSRLVVMNDVPSTMIILILSETLVRLLLDVPSLCVSLDPTCNFGPKTYRSSEAIEDSQRSTPIHEQICDCYHLYFFSLRYMQNDLTWLLLDGVGLTPTPLPKILKLPPVPILLLSPKPGHPTCSWISDSTIWLEISLFAVVQNVQWPLTLSKFSYCGTSSLFFYPPNYHEVTNLTLPSIFKISDIKTVILVAAYLIEFFEYIFKWERFNLDIDLKGIYEHITTLLSG